MVNFSDQLSKQLRFLDVSCREYDNGNEAEAIRIATVLRVLFHDTASSTSLLKHLGATGINVLSTVGKRPSNNPKEYWPALMHIEISFETGVIRCRPTFNNRPTAHRFIPVSAWWDGEPVLFACGRKLKRKPLILSAANKDGGAHVDSQLTEDYAWMVNGAAISFGIQKLDGRKWEATPPNAHLAYLRQMAHEVLNSPELIALDPSRKEEAATAGF